MDQVWYVWVFSNLHSPYSTMQIIVPWFTTNKDTSWSISSYVFLFVGGVDLWQTKKQATIALTTKERLWLKSIDERDILNISEFKLWCDN